MSGRLVPLPAGAKTARLKVSKSGGVSITGLTQGDVRLIAQALDRGAYGADNGGPHAEAIDSLASRLRQLILYRDMTMEIVAGGSDPTLLYREVNRAGLVEC